MSLQTLVKNLSQYESFDSQSYLTQYGLNFIGFKKDSLKKISDRAVVLNVGKDGFAVLKSKDWDTRVFGFKTYVIDDIYIKKNIKAKERILEELLKKVLVFVGKEKVCFLNFRFDAKYFKYLQVFEKYGFKTQDVMVTFLYKTAGKINGRKNPATNVAQPKDLKKILELSKGSFKTARVSTDLNITPAESDRFYSTLAKDILSKEDNFTLVYRQKKDIAAYVIGMDVKDVSQFLKKKVGCLWLIAVSEKYRNKQIGKKLLTEFFNQYGRRVDYIEISTQIHNLAAMSLYLSVGLIPKAYCVTLHYWRSR